MRESVSVAEAQRFVLDVAPVLGAETVTAREALGRVLAGEITSTLTLPPDDCSAMDGYAVRRADLAGVSSHEPRELKIRYEIPAGARPPERELGDGEAARIFTGAPVPLGADAVVRQEDTETHGSRVAFLIEPGARDHIRNAGEDIRSGARVLETGTVVHPAQLGLIASLGRSMVEVYQRPKVAILSGGDELIEPDGDSSGGRIVSSNSYAMAGQCIEAGAEPLYLGIAQDRPEDIESHLRAGLRADCIVSSAGVSVGDRDYMRGVLAELGCRLDFWGVRMKPGFPMAFGRFPGNSLPLVFGLPGNPVSAMVTFEQFVRPVLRKMGGHRTLFRPVVKATLAHSLEKNPGRLHYIRVRLKASKEGWSASTTGNQSSGVLTSMAVAHGLLVFPEEATRLNEGESVSVHLLDPEVLATSSEPV